MSLCFLITYLKVSLIRNVVSHTRQPKKDPECHAAETMIRFVQSVRISQVSTEDQFAAHT